MKPFATLLTMISFALLLSGCQGTKTETSGAEMRANASNAGDIYIPRDLDEALVEVDRIMEEEKGRADVLKATEDDMVKYHMGFGMWIRNEWIRAAGSPLRQYFNQFGIHHPDDMSGIILHSYWRKLHGKPIDLEGQVRYYQDYWKQQKRKQ